MQGAMFHPWQGGQTPAGAVEAHKPTAFLIRPGRGLCVTAATLVLEREGGGRFAVPMKSAGVENLADVFCCAFTPQQPGLYAYWFELTCMLGSRFLCADEDDAGVLLESRGAAWQLSVFAQGFDTPHWPRGGVMYQIFPDRFYKAPGPVPPQPEGRVCREDWGGAPEYRPDAQGRVLNNDYFGGNLRGIAEKLPYLVSLGVTVLYLNPIFEAHSNHRYNTADYFKIDPLLGTQEDFSDLCERAEQCGIRIVLDGVFNHTGDDSVYFNRAGRYPEPGAFQSKDSHWFSWYRFGNWPVEYASWWGFKTLPAVNGEQPEYAEFITGEQGVVRHWLRAGAQGWRLDVADELPESLIQKIRAAVKAHDPESLLIGEVWEDASNKISYGSRRHYFEGAELDSAMNYPFRDAIIAFLRGGEAENLQHTVENLLSHYPPQCTHVLMNLLGTHDTPRLMTALAGDDPGGRGRDWMAGMALTPRQRETGVKLVKQAAALQFFLPGIPCVYYGDEIGMEGYADPFNRRCFAWEEPHSVIELQQRQELLSWYSGLSIIRAGCPALKEGCFRTLAAQGGLFAFLREDAGSALICAVNIGARDQTLTLPENRRFHIAAQAGQTASDAADVVPAGGCLVLVSD